MSRLKRNLRAFLTLILVLWFFSGWPQIWQNPPFPPKIQEVQAATLPTLRPVSPNGTISNYTNQAGGTTDLWSVVDDDPDSPNTADYVKNSASANASVFFNLTDMPSDFSSMGTLQIDFYLNAPANWSDDTGILYGQVFQSDETTTLTSEHQLATQTTGAGYYSVTFTTVTGGNKTVWDGARLRLRVAYSKSKGPDDGQIRVATLELDGTYTVSAGALTVDIVDSGGTSVGSPSVAMSDVQLSFSCQTSTGTFGVSEERIRVTNTTASPAWTLTVAATNGSTATWSTGSLYYDFNDGGGSGCTDGGDSDGYAGQMTQDPSVGTITPQGGCSTTGLSLGSSTAYSEGVTDSITLLSASASAESNCYWDLTGISVSQKIPSEQSTGNYSINMTLTVTAS